MSTESPPAPAPASPGSRFDDGRDSALAEPASASATDPDGVVDAEAEAVEEEPARPKALLAIDVGGTKFAVGIVTSRGELVDRSIGMVQRDVGPEAHIEMLAELIAEQRQVAEERHHVQLVAAGVGSAGPIEPNCVAVSPLNIPAWRDFPLQPRVAELVELPTYGDLDSKALALAEGWLGAAKGVDNYCAMTVSTGVGGGIVLDGRLIDGASGNAGHVGHIIVEPNGRRCRCGSRGCLEAEASGTAIEAITGRPPTEPTYEIMERTGQMVGRAAASICNLFDIDLVVVGGGVALGFAATFFNAATVELNRQTALKYSRQARIVSSRLGDRAPLIGAAAVAIRGLRRERAARRASAALAANSS